jgi:hypothetical protein
MHVFCSFLRYSDDDDDDASELGLVNLYTFHFVPCFKMHVNTEDFLSLFFVFFFKQLTMDEIQKLGGL